MKRTWKSLLVAVATVIALFVLLTTSLSGCPCQPDDVIIYDPVHLPCLPDK